MESNKKIKLLHQIASVKGIVLVLLGIFHILFSFVEFNLIKNEMSQKLSQQYILWFYATGVFLIFIGVIDIFSSLGLKQRSLLSWKISLTTSIFTFFTGLSGMIGLNWEISPPYLIFLTGIIYLIPLLLFRKEFKILAVSSNS